MEAEKLKDTKYHFKSRSKEARHNMDGEKLMRKAVLVCSISSEMESIAKLVSYPELEVIQWNLYPKIWTPWLIRTLD